MNDGDFLIDILDNNGSKVAEKLRKEVVKGVDIYHAVYAVLVTPTGSLVMNLIADRQDMPNYHAGSYGCTAATIKRSEESADQAMKRALKNELGLENEPTLINESVIEVDGTFRKIGLYTLQADKPKEFNREDIADLVEVSEEGFADLVANQPEKITPLLRMFWEHYSKK